MAQSTATYESRTSQRLQEIAGVCLLGLTTMLMLSLVSYTPSDPSWFSVSSSARVVNLVGEPGAYVAALLVHVLGLGAFALAACALGASLRLIAGSNVRGRLAAITGSLLLVVTSAALCDILLERVVFGGETAAAGGIVGMELGTYLRRRLSVAGAAVALSTTFCLGLILFTNLSLGRTVRLAQRTALHALASVRLKIVRRLEARRKDKRRRDVITRHVEEIREEVKGRRKTAPAEIVPPAQEAAPAPEAPERPAKVAATRERVKGFIAEREAKGKGGKAPIAVPEAEHAEPPEPVVPAPERVPSGKVDVPVAPRAEQLSLPGVEAEGEAVGLPPVSLLRAPEGEIEIDERGLFDRGKALEAKFREFQVSGTVIQIHPGPVVTTYEYKPDPGIKYSRLTSLADDLCLALKAESIRIDRIAGKSTVGIEVPNVQRETIFLREILTADVWKGTSSPLTLALGKLINGEPYCSDLAKMPHLLIAGSTGQGKSVALHAMIASILFRATPDEVRMVMIDPKTVELTVYDGIPHLLCPVVVDPKLASNALKWAIREMESRYKMLARYGVRSIDQFNAILRSGAPPAERFPEGAPAGETPRILPYVVVVIDELADLMMVASADVEEAITRLAQMARAVGIHVILATQRPSVDVITGVIKANFPARISFRVASRTDSRTILDANGAEQLLGNGDMLLLAPGTSRLIRVHGPLITEREAAALAAYLKKRGKPIYEEAVTKAPEKAPGEGGGEEVDDEMYREAVRLVVRTGQASVSNLQRKLRLGYSRAARLVDLMEEEGIVSKADGARPRQVLMSAREYDIRFGQVT